MSLDEQRDAILAYARANNIRIIDWFTETITAAKQGRPQFQAMLKALRGGKADGLVIHKIDRSARNLHDWADLADLTEHGLKVHIAHEGLDLASRGGRLSADIQAVVASDYIRNLRQEARKGFYGNLKKGLYPLKAPLGYVNHGKGKVKTLDPVRAPLVKEAFILYGSGRYSLRVLVDELRRRGLRTRANQPISIDRLSKTLANPFYTGLIRIRTTGETFDGIHEPLISAALFEKAREVASGRLQTRVVKHGLLFRRLFRCASCQKTIIGERQKIYVYYRCHEKECPFKTVREELLDASVTRTLANTEFSRDAQEEVWEALKEATIERHSLEANRVQALTLEREKIAARLDRLTDGFLDGAISQQVFGEQQERLSLKKRELEENQNSVGIKQGIEQARQYLELSFKASLSYQAASDADKRETIQLMTSNRQVKPNEVSVELREPFSFVANARALLHGAPSRDVHRMTKRWSAKLIQMLLNWTTNNSQKPE